MYGILYYYNQITIAAAILTHEQCTNYCGLTLLRLLFKLDLSIYTGLVSSKMPSIINRAMPALNAICCSRSNKKCIETFSNGKSPLNNSECEAT
jgi:hypothetical protein